MQRQKNKSGLRMISNSQRQSYCEFDPAQMKQVSDSLDRLAHAIEHSGDHREMRDEKFLHAITDLTSALNELRGDILPVAMDRDQVPLKVLYICVIVTAAAALGAAMLKDIAGIL